jgi:hypothetical protein
MVPVQVISPVTITRLDEPTLEPPFPTSRVDPESSNTGAGADEGYSPSQQPLAHQNAAEAETEPAATTPDTTHQVNLFA